MLLKQQTIQFSAHSTLYDLIVPKENILRKINDFLWDIEDGKRAHERAKDFGENFIHLAREVYIKNDERAKIKKSINKKK